MCERYVIVGGAAIEDGRRLCHTPSHGCTAAAVEVRSGAYPGSRANQTGRHGPWMRNSMNNTRHYGWKIHLVPRACIVAVSQLSSFLRALEYIRELLSFMMAGPSLSFRPLKLICCYGIRWEQKTLLPVGEKKSNRSAITHPLTSMIDWMLTSSLKYTNPYLQKTQRKRLNTDTQKKNIRKKKELQQSCEKKLMNIHKTDVEINSRHSSHPHTVTQAKNKFCTS